MKVLSINFTLNARVVVRCKSGVVGQTTQLIVCKTIIILGGCANMEFYAQLIALLEMLYANEARFKHIKVLTKFDGFKFVVIYYDKLNRQVNICKFYKMEDK